MTPYIRKAGMGLLAFLLTTSLSIACFTDSQMQGLRSMHPNLDLDAIMHEMHGQPKIDYMFRGANGCVDGMSDIFPCSGVELAGWLELDGLGDGLGTDNWGWTDPDTGRMYALMGRTNGVAFVDMTNPENPVYLGNLPRPSGVPPSTWSDIKTYQNHALIVADGVNNHGMLVFDLTRLRGMTEPPPGGSFTSDAQYNGFNQAHNIVVNEGSGYAYAVGSETCGGGGLHMINVENPKNPQGVGCFGGDGYTHDAQCVMYSGPDAEYHGREICFASNIDSLTVVDVTDKSNPEMLGKIVYAGRGYSHQGWLTPDHEYFISDDELDEKGGITPDGRTRTLVFDITDLDNLPEPEKYDAQGSAIDHNQYVVGNYTFQANYHRGMRVLRIDDPKTADLTEVAYFDTHPESEGIGWSGAWSVYPFFDNGLVLISDRNRGLFVVRVTEPDVVFALSGILKDGFESTP